MTTIKVNKQIAFLRKQKGLTQEELANALGVTNQAVSKWESAQCCPDIQILPDIAKFFDVSVDELLGYKAVDRLGDICLKIKDYSVESVSYGGCSVCGEPEGSTARKNNCIFFSVNEGYVSPNRVQLRELMLTLQQFSDLNVLKVMYALYGLTHADFDLYVTVDEIAYAANLKSEDVENALKDMPLTVKEEDDKFKYRLEGSFSHIPPLLSFYINYKRPPTFSDSRVYIGESFQ